jgi:hypothetical protein
MKRKMSQLVNRLKNPVVSSAKMLVSIVDCGGSDGQQFNAIFKDPSFMIKYGEKMDGIASMSSLSSKLCE